jgi:hypothetical protein
MATDRYYVCPRCGGKTWAGSLLDSLLAVAKGDRPSCHDCHGTCALHLSFALGLGATGGDCSVIDAFLPDEPISWPDKEGRRVTFYPFLVITNGKDGRGAWLPYWHVVQHNGADVKKYGQWAPFMDLSTFRGTHRKSARQGPPREVRPEPGLTPVAGDRGSLHRGA